MPQLPANEAKEKAAQLFFDVYVADERLAVAGGVDDIRSFVQNAITYDVMSNAVVLNGAQLYEALVNFKRAPSDPMLQALAVLEPRAAKIGVTVRQPDAIRRLSHEDKQKLAAKAPRSHSPLLDEIDSRFTPGIIKDARNTGRNRTRYMAAAVVGSIVIAIYVGVTLRKPLQQAQVLMPADGVGCTSMRAQHELLICVVDEAPLDALDDDAVRARIKKSQEAAKKQGYTQVSFLKPGTGPDGEQHRYKPFLWHDEVQPIPVTLDSKGKTSTRVTGTDTPPPPPPPPTTPH